MIDSVNLLYHSYSLYQFNEPVLFDKNPSDSIFIRLACFPSFQKSIIIRIEGDRNNYRITAKQTGNNQRKITHFNTKILTKKELKELKKYLNNQIYKHEIIETIYDKAGISDSLKFRYVKKDSEIDNQTIDEILDKIDRTRILQLKSSLDIDVATMDGTTWIFEVYTPNREYHMIQRHSNTEYSISNFFMELLELVETRNLVEKE